MSDNARLGKFLQLGFDESTTLFGQGNLIVIKCSQCKAVVICGTATHEHGCPNQMRKCRVCDTCIGECTGELE